MTRDTKEAARPRPPWRGLPREATPAWSRRLIFGERDTAVGSSIQVTLSPGEGGTVVEVVHRNLPTDETARHAALLETSWNAWFCSGWTGPRPGLATASYRVGELAKGLVCGRENGPAQDHLARPRPADDEAPRGRETKATVLVVSEDTLAGQRPH